MEKRGKQAEIRRKLGETRGKLRGNRRETIGFLWGNKRGIWRKRGGQAEGNRSETRKREGKGWGKGESLGKEGEKE